MIDLKAKTDAELVALYGEVMGELHSRGVVRSGNNPIADMAEHIIADYYGVSILAPNHKSLNLIAPDGARIEVKALRRTKPSRRGLSPLRTLDFDFVAVVIFAVDMRLEERRSLFQSMLLESTWAGQRHGNPIACR